MRTAGLAILVAMAVMLAVLDVLELRSAPAKAPTDAVQSASTRTYSAPPSSGPVRGGGAVQSILSRPLFDPSRRPPERTAAASPAAKPAALPRLAGIVVDAGRRIAILTPGREGHAVALGEGGVLDGYRVETIGTRDVVLAGQGGRHTLALSFAVQSSEQAPPPSLPVVAPAGLPTGLPTLPQFNGPPGLQNMPKFVPPPGGENVLPGLGGIPGLPLPGAPPGR